MKLVGMIKTDINETYSKVRIGKHSSHRFPIQNSVTQKIILKLLLCNLT
jgi:hypothetical protein